MDEIERKFLVRGDAWRNAVTAKSRIIQGYVAASSSRSVRIRLRDDNAVLTVKVGSDPLCRTEVEFEIPLKAAREVLSVLSEDELVRKHRSLIPASDGLVWEIDVFEGRLAGLVLAEIELAHPAQYFDVPDWLGSEVTKDPTFLNENLRLMKYSELGLAPRR